MGAWRSSPSSHGEVWPFSPSILSFHFTRHATLNTLPLHKYSWAQLDELVVDGLSEQELRKLRQLDASCWERMLLAGVRVLVGGATD